MTYRLALTNSTSLVISSNVGTFETDFLRSFATISRKFSYLVSLIEIRFNFKIDLEEVLQLLDSIGLFDTFSYPKDTIFLFP